METKKKRSAYVILGFVLGIILSVPVGGYIIDLKIAETREMYRGMPLPLEEGRVYKAVVVLTYPTGQGEGTVWHLVGNPTIWAVGRQPIEPGKTYIMDQGLRLVTEVKMSRAKSKK